MNETPTGDKIRNIRLKKTAKPRKMLNCIEFLSPAISCTEKCCHCKLCMKTCPVQAIALKNNHLNVDRDSCLSYQQKTGDDCLRCVSVCPTGIVRLVVFSKEESGEIIEKKPEL